MPALKAGTAGARFAVTGTEARGATVFPLTAAAGFRLEEDVPRWVVLEPLAGVGAGAAPATGAESWAAGGLFPQDPALLSVPHDPLPQSPLGADTGPPQSPVGFAGAAE